MLRRPGPEKMLVFIVLLLALVPAVAIAYPLLRRSRASDLPEDESSPQAELSRRWDAALAGLRNTELESALGNLAPEDYRWLREQYLTEAALVIKSMELEEEQEQELLSTVERDIQQVRLNALGQDGSGHSMVCPHCSSDEVRDAVQCSSCGRPLARVEPPARHDSESSSGVVGE